EVRQVMNGMIYLGGVLTPGMFVLNGLLVLSRNPPTQVSAIASLDDGPLKQKLTHARMQAVKETIRFLCLEGLLGIFVRFLFVLSRVVHITSDLTGRAKIWAVRGREQTET